MARIRTIKPEFSQSESMGQVSRDARLAFVLMWTQADDSGRLRGNPRMLASVLFPYDEDAQDLMDNWMGELTRVGSIQRYLVDGKSYVQIKHWREHQRIDKPTASKIPSPGGDHPGIFPETDTDTDTDPETKTPEPEQPRVEPVKEREGQPIALWLGRLKELWPREQYDKARAPRSSSAEVEKRFTRIINGGKVTSEELTVCGHLYTRERLSDRQYVVSLETFLGGKRIWEDYMDRAREIIARNHGRGEE